MKFPFVIFFTRQKNKDANDKKNQDEDDSKGVKESNDQCDFSKWMYSGIVFVEE